MSNTFSPNRNKAIWNCARECALHRQARSCKHKFGSSACDRCRFYIHKYGNFTRADADLLMMQAEGDVLEKKSSNNMIWWFVAGLIIFCLVIYFGAELPPNYFRNLIFGNPRDRVPAATSVQSTTNAAVDTERAIWFALQRVARYMNEGIDVDGDGLVNCIDAALAFYRYYPYRNEVRIILNRHPDGRMNHLFNAVRIGRRWVYIEPQAHWGKHRHYTMDYVWRSTNNYNPWYNRNVTDTWRRYTIP